MQVRWTSCYLARESAQDISSRPVANENLLDPRVRNLVWRDLVTLSRTQVLCELVLVFPWLAGALVCAHFAGNTHWVFYGPALVCSFIFFLTGLRVVHNGYHYALGIPRLATEWVIFGLSLLMGWPLHSVQVNHLRHHKYCMEDEDIEAASARMSGWRALLFGPIFPFLLLGYGIYFGNPRKRQWIMWESLALLSLLATAFLILDIHWLRFHICCMAIGECLTAFFAVWTVHHDCERDHLFARTLEGKWKNRLTFNMFLHMEHHLFPAVPTRNLPQLAERLGAAAPDLRGKEVF